MSVIDDLDDFCWTFNQSHSMWFISVSVFLILFIRKQCKAWLHLHYTFALTLNSLYTYQLDIIKVFNNKRVKKILIFYIFRVEFFRVLQLLLMMCELWTHWMCKLFTINRNASNVTIVWLLMFIDKLPTHTLFVYL